MRSSHLKTQKIKLHQIDEKIENCLDSRKAKMLLEFTDRQAASIKLFAIKKKATTLRLLHVLCLVNC